MQEWKLPSQLIITENSGNETPEQMFLKHETIRRITAESDLIKCLDFIESLIDGKNETSPKIFLHRFLDKTINN